jgi:hypothetical protein
MTKRMYLLLLLLPLFVSVFGQRQKAPVRKKSDVYVVATLYKRHERSVVYSLDTLRKIIERIKPDVLVLDVSPTELSEQKVFPGKIEYPQVIFPYLNKQNITAYAGEPAEPVFSKIVDETLADINTFRTANPAAATQLDEYEQRMWALLDTYWKTPADVNNAVTGSVLTAKRILEGQMIGKRFAEGDISWNQHIAAITRKAVLENAGKKVLVLIGIENCSTVRTLLKNDSNINLVNISDWLSRF